MGPIVEMCGITKRFSSTLVNDQVDLSCYPGEILCLLGENGAGKTTLMKILYGLYKQDTGTILYKGHPVTITGPRKAISLGIQMVHQHFMLVPTLSVADNIVLGKEPVHKGLYDKKGAVRIAQELSERYGLKVPSDKLVKDLSVGEQQRTEIIKALYQGAEVLILDEPTAVLTPQEVEELFAVMLQLKADGKSAIIITHKLKETMSISDRVCVLRNGRMAGECKTSETNIDQLSEMMVGRRVYPPKKSRINSDELVIDLQHVTMKSKEKSTDNAAIEMLKDIHFSVYKHEVVGIAGVEGNGQKEVINMLSGLMPSWEGEILYNGRSIKGWSTARLLEEGISVIYADRHKYSVALDQKVPENFLLGSQDGDEFCSRKGILRWKKIPRTSEEMMRTFDVNPLNLNMKMQDFSGGNQQKFVVGREIRRNPRLLVAAHPTRGVDISATEFIHKQLLEQKQQGAGVLVISSDLDELMALSDRIAVIYNGRIVAFDETDKFNAFSLGKWMGGGEDA